MHKHPSAAKVRISQMGPRAQLPQPHHQETESPFWCGCGGDGAAALFMIEEHRESEREERKVCTINSAPGEFVARINLFSSWRRTEEKAIPPLTRPH
jgi:hypothetical protein